MFETPVAYMFQIARNEAAGRERKQKEQQADWLTTETIEQTAEDRTPLDDIEFGCHRACEIGSGTARN